MSYKQNHGGRHSLLDVTQASRYRPRCASMSVVDSTSHPGSSGGMPRRASATPTPCTTPYFVSPHMAFTTQFSYDSPIQVSLSPPLQVLTSSPRAMSKFRRRCSLRGLPHWCKMILILMFFAIASGLFIYRTVNGRRSVSVLSLAHDCQDDDHDCQDLDDELVHDHPSLKRFMRAAKQPPPFHILTADLDDSDVRTAEEQQVLESDDSDAGYLQGGALQELPSEELMEQQLESEAQEPLDNHWLPQLQDQSRKMQRLTIQGQYREDFQQPDALQTPQVQQYNLQDHGHQSQHYIQGEYSHQAQHYAVQGEPSPRIQQYGNETNSPVQQNIQQAGTQQQYSVEYSNQPMMQENWPEMHAMQGELANRIPQYQYAEYANLEQQHILQNLEREQQHGLGQEWAMPEQRRRQAGEELQRQQHQGSPRPHHDHPRPPKMQQQQRKSSGQPGEARPRRPQDKTPQQTSRKLQRQQEAGQKPGRGEEKGGSRGQGQRLPPGVNPRRYLSDL